MLVDGANVVDELALRAPKANPTFTGTVVAPVLNVTTDLSCGTLTCESLYGGAVNQIKTNVLSNPSITGSATVANNLTVSGLLAVDTITKRLANEVTVNCDLAVGGTLLVDTIDSSFATQITVLDNVVIGSSGTNKNLTLNGNLSVAGTLSVINFLPTKPWVGFLCTTAVGVASLSYHVGFKTTGVSISDTAGGTYSITIPADPN